jgi:hypothetical protein
LIWTFADVFCQEAEGPISMLLQQSILATISPVRFRVAQVLPAVKFDGDVRRLAKQVDFHAAPAIERNRQLGIQAKPPGRLG